jgi:bifunctional non-homologous end joining protein LigD
LNWSGKRAASLIWLLNGYDRTETFGAPFSTLVATAGHELVIDGEIAVPDDRGVTHLDFLDDAISRREPRRLVYYAFDLLHIDGHDLRRCPIEQRKEVLRLVLDEARCERIIYVDHIGYGRQLLEAVRRIGAEGVVSKRLGSLYRGRGADWLKTKCHETGGVRDHRLSGAGRRPA